MRTASVTVVAGGNRAGPVVSTTITPDRTWTVGRSTDSDIVVDDSRVSRRHLVVENSGPAWVIRDVSANGSWLAGTRVGPGGVAIPDFGEIRLRLGDSAGPELVVAGSATRPVSPGGPVGFGSPVGLATVPLVPSRRHHRTRWLVAVVAVLVLLFVVADRVAAAAASTEAVGQVVQQSQGLNGKPTVSFGGFPFLTQVAFGRYTDIHIGIDNLTLPAGPQITHVSAQLKGAHIPLSKALHNDTARIPVDHIAATVTIGFAALNGYLKNQPGQLVVSQGSGGTVKVTGSATGSDLPINVAGSGQLKVQSGQLTVIPDDIQVAGIGGLSDLIQGLGGLGALFPPIPVALPDLPFNLRLTAVHASSGGVVVSAAADHVVLDTGQ